MGQPLPAEKTADAMQAIAAWRRQPDGVLSCPVCSKPGLSIADCSARPYSEWYILKCAHCGLDAAIAIPMAPPASA